MTGEPPPDVSELVADGFVLLEDLPLRQDLLVLWPAEHRRAVPETRPERADSWPDGLCHLVRSPWPGLAAPDVVGLLLAWLRERDPRWGRWETAEDDERRLVIERDFFVAFDAAFREEWDNHLREWM